MKNLDIKHFKTTLFIITFMVLNLPSNVVAKPQVVLANHQLTASYWDAVSEQKLDTLRAGFVLSNGVIVDISFDKRVLINDIEKSNSYFQTPQNVSLVKNGDLNISSEFQDTIFQSVIQNTLDNQVLKTINTINIDIKNLNYATDALSKNHLYNQYFLPSTHQ
jgi:hypothetical protein